MKQAICRIPTVTLCIFLISCLPREPIVTLSPDEASAGKSFVVIGVKVVDAIMEPVPKTSWYNSEDSSAFSTRGGGFQYFSVPPGQYSLSRFSLSLGMPLLSMGDYREAKGYYKKGHDELIVFNTRAGEAVYVGTIAFSLDGVRSTGAFSIEVLDEYEKASQTYLNDGDKIFLKLKKSLANTQEKKLYFSRK